MALALGRLRITPRDFWALTMSELDAIVRGALARHAPSATPLDRAALDALRARFPD